MGEDFSFPFPPYNIQVDLMKKIYECIDESRIGIFESPTGTGKSLSIICAMLTWLEKYEKAERARLEALCESCANTETDNADDWIETYRRKFSAKKKASEAEEQLEMIRKVEEKVRNLGKRIDTHKRKLCDDNEEVVDDFTDTSTANDLEEEFVVQEDYTSDCEEDDNSEETSLSCLKIFYATRTHSQLEQFTDELFKTRFRPRIVTIGSRNVLCLNEKVRSLKSSALINEKCNELRDAKGSVKIHRTENTKRKGKSPCPFYKPQAIEILSNEILATKASTTFKVVTFGKKTSACPYFASKQAAPLCQLVLLPYQVLLHNDTRKAWGVSLKDNIVVIDEAHNLLQVIASVYSAEVTRTAVTTFQELLQKYISRYKSRTSAKNLLYIRQLYALTGALKRLMDSYSNKGVDDILPLEKFLVQTNAAETNLFELTRSMEKMNIWRKLHGFFLWSRSRPTQRNCSISKDLTGVEKVLQKKAINNSQCTDAEGIKVPLQIASPVYIIRQFLEALTSVCADSRIVFQNTTPEREACFKHVLLNTAEKLMDIVRSVRALVLIGGTMEPADYLLHSLHKVCKEKIMRFSCGHVIDESQLLAFSIGKAPNGLDMILNFGSRSCTPVLNGLAMILMNLLRLIPNGAVVFFPSYDFMYRFETHLKNDKTFEKINAIKPILTERKTTVTTDIWDDFVVKAKSSHGAVLFAVIGGKLSEGINFSDELGRCVFMVGLPYSNKSDIELSERMKYLDLKLGAGSGTEMYESTCLHAVNQAIGRVIRHRNDYAAIILIDSRFTQQKIIKGLPQWIKTRLKHCDKFGEAVSLLSHFFRQKKPK